MKTPETVKYSVYEEALEENRALRKRVGILLGRIKYLDGQLEVALMQRRQIKNNQQQEMQRNTWDKIIAGCNNG